MDKPYYETEEYSEAKNELDTYDDPVKLVMEYRVSEKHKDSQITELQKQLEEKERLLQYGMTEIKKLNKRISDIVERDKKLLKSQSVEIAEKINGEIYTRMVVEGKETKYTDINLILNNILKEYQK